MSALFTFLGAIAFYTCLPIPHQWRLQFLGIARWIVVVGLLIGGVLSLLDWGLFVLGVPSLTRSGLIVATWVAITGGLHLDGAMDTADGLGVLDPERRLQVMADSHTGAFGAIAAVIILLLKTIALGDTSTARWFVLMSVAGWGRWAQLLAIARFPYLKPNSKGAIHKVSIRSVLEALPSLLLLLGFSGLHIYLNQGQWFVGLVVAISGAAIAVLTGEWFNYKLGGHTGDTYGATVEWTEALLLCVLTIVF